MHHQVVNLIHSWVILINLPLSGLQYIPNSRVPYDPETDLKMTTPALDSDQWWRESSKVQYPALLFAGIYEFNWIVDIRMDAFHTSLRSVGNLVTSINVLTTCRALRDFETLSHSMEDIHVYFASHYLRQKYPKKSKSGDKYDGKGMSGVRPVYRFWFHPKCTKNKLLWDTAIIVLRNEILPYLPSVGYIPIPIDASGKVLVDEKKKRILCYVASFGRKTRTRHEGSAYFLDFKVKYRVYPVELKRCLDASKFMCTWPEPNCVDERDASSQTCLEVRARVGSVCDHDRGAPVVCDGLVRGLVLRAAAQKSCSSVIHVPFFAMPLQGFYEYFENGTFDPAKPLSQGTSLKKVYQTNEIMTILLIFLILFSLLQ